VDVESVLGENISLEVDGDRREIEYMCSSSESVMLVGMSGGEDVFSVNFRCH